jgi:hypothetical protein
MLDHIYSPDWKVSFYNGAIGKEPINGGREKMMPYAQSVLCSIWEKTERDPDGSFGVDVSEFANTNTVLTASRLLKNRASQYCFSGFGPFSGVFAFGHVGVGAPRAVFAARGDTTTPSGRDRNRNQLA